MKKNQTFILVATLLTFITFSSCHNQQPAQPDNSFTFAFLTDIHIQPEMHAVEGFRQAIDAVNKLRPDFVITGGDLVRDALGQTRGRADSLYQLYKEETSRFTMPVYNTMGNHEVFGWYLKHGVSPETPDFGKKMFEKNLGKRYYSFEHKGWKFFILDDIDSLDQAYYGHISADQISWLTGELAKTDTLMPLVVVAHIPFITAQAQFHNGGLAANSRGGVIENGREVLDLFNHHNLKLVLQGHLHIYEDIFTHNKHFITGGAVCGGWWSGPHDGTQEGFLLVKAQGDSVSAQYIDDGWEPVKAPAVE
ncbi:MAG: metallophosphoesterase [Chlorobi bacterium]|nr:metallophosphoesterase [Chlorobiota bacterium]